MRFKLTKDVRLGLLLESPKDTAMFMSYEDIMWDAFTTATGIERLDLAEAIKERGGILEFEIELLSASIEDLRQRREDLAEQEDAEDDYARQAEEDARLDMQSFYEDTRGDS